MKTLGRFFDFLINAMAVLASTIMLVMMLSTVFKVIMRAFFNRGIQGVDQISGTMMVYIAFLGAAWVLRNEGHITIDLLTGYLSEKTRRQVEIFGSIVGAIACFTIAYVSGVATVLSIQRGVVVAAELEIPRAINLWVIPFGSAVLGIEFILRSVRFYQGVNVVPPLEGALPVELEPKEA